MRYCAALWDLGAVLRQQHRLRGSRAAPHLCVRCHVWKQWPSEFGFPQREQSGEQDLSGITGDNMELQLQAIHTSGRETLVNGRTNGRDSGGKLHVDHKPTGPLHLGARAGNG